jgi:hypothetical protein
MGSAGEAYHPVSDGLAAITVTASSVATSNNTYAGAAILN